MESFHMVMAEAYHPYKDSANLEPVKSLAENLAKESEKGGRFPLEKLKKDCRALADQVKEANEQIGAARRGERHYGIKRTRDLKVQIISIVKRMPGKLTYPRKN